MKNKTISVVGGIILEKNKLLICQRRPYDDHPLKWEFPGGKVKSQEKPNVALERELKEELKIEVLKSQFLHDYIFEYKKLNKKIHLHFYLIHKFIQKVQNTVHNELKWIEIKQLSDYDFLEGDHTIIKKILKNEFKIY